MKTLKKISGALFVLALFLSLFGLACVVTDALLGWRSEPALMYKGIWMLGLACLLWVIAGVFLRLGE